MASINQVVQLANGSTGVIGELLPSPGAQQYRCHFDESYLDILDADIAQTLSAPTYNVNDDVSVWPDAGVISAIDGDTFTVEATRQDHVPGLGYVTWTATLKVPRWRVIRDNDSRIERVWE